MLVVIGAGDQCGGDYGVVEVVVIDCGGGGGDGDDAVVLVVM